MRTTVTLDDDLARTLKRRAHERDLPFKSVLNETIRRGLGEGSTPKPYRMKPRPLGVRPGINLDKARLLAAELEDEETARELERGR